MNLVQRYYRPGDEVSINRLYKLITGADRSIEEYRWEWIETWDGQGNIWLAFDGERAVNDQLIMQYSLIPVPFSFWGEPFLAGKTENCMSHPAYRGAGVYFPHEKKGFEEAKQRFQVFFTTAGKAGKGAAGAVRRKLGYVALASWVEFVYLINADYVSKLVGDRLAKKVKLPNVLIKYFSSIFAKVILAFFQPKASKNICFQASVFDCCSVPLEQIEKLWNDNKILYGVTVDRHQSYMSWRINKNPSFEYRWLTLFQGERMIGYCIFFRNAHNAFRVVDMLADQKDACIFSLLLSELMALARRERVGAILCATVKSDRFIQGILRRSGFICREWLSMKKYFARKQEDNDFFIYISDGVPGCEKVFKPENWYITSLMKEGRR